MSLAWISLLALLIAITLSMVSTVNVGVVSLAFAWIVGVYLGGMRLSVVIGTFPVDLLLNLVGVTLLFGMANLNGTLGRIAARAVSACRGNAGVIPIMLFFIALGLSSIGPGNIATTAIMFTRKPRVEPLMAQSDQVGARADAAIVEVEPFAATHWLTMAVLVILVVVVIEFRAHVGLAALTGAAILSLLKAANEKEAIKRMPWGVIIMVCGVTVLIGVLAAQGGMDLFRNMLAAISTPATVTFMMALVTGAVSVYSSTSGVVLPAFLPTVPGLAQQIGADPMAIASSMNVGGHLVDLSPLSTIGALCIAALPDEADAKKLFNQLLAWGLSMILVGAVICWILF
jgi:di/tricarboxylate transporter